MVTIEYRRVLGPITETRHVETVEEALAFSAHLILRHCDVRCMKRDAQLLLTGDQICAALDNLGNDSAFVLEERYIVRRCHSRKCRLLAMHPARLFMNKNGTLRVTVMCLKCRTEFGAAVKKQEWSHLEDG